MQNRKAPKAVLDMMVEKVDSVAKRYRRPYILILLDDETGDTKIGSNLAPPQVDTILASMISTAKDPKKREPKTPLQKMRDKFII